MMMFRNAPQPDQLYFGGLGLFTANGIPKASCYAFTLLRELGDTLLGKGDGWIATKQNDDFIILPYNYRHFSQLYARGERFDMTFTIDIRLSPRNSSWTSILPCAA